MTANTKPTVYGNAISVSDFFNRQYVPEPGTTLNELLDIQNNVNMLADERHGLSYYVIGNKGGQFITGADSLLQIDNYEHNPTDAGMFGMIPFAIKPLAADFSATDRAKYRLRKQETIASADYWVYYGRVIELGTVNVSLTQRDVDANGNVTVSPFVPVASRDLTPEPITIASGDNRVITNERSSVSATAPLSIVFDSVDVAEFKNAMQIKYNSSSYVIITEMGLVSAVDRTIALPGGTGGEQYNESHFSLVVSHTPTLQTLMYTNGGFTFDSDVGVPEPLFTKVVP